MQSVNGSRRRQSKNRPQSFNNRFCREYFDDWLVRESFYYFTELLFVDLCPVKLADCFGAKCCLEPLHDSSCVELWVDFKQFVQSFILQEIGL